MEEKGLTIGGFESVFFADLVAAYLMGNAQQLFKNSRYNGIYRDDGINVINGKRSTEQMVEWLDSFQAQVNELTESEHLCTRVSNLAKSKK